ncbi:uncharacterized protein B0T23DRAFT_457089 [Neurospora hispaniola]|uniref:Uncharacterized protein n=1 Tax=Neurospora hispaniola TaxID=588809 RepID=A0AAJ0MLR0_9PEZI|nr:hypothetical protein B0T23DRAFT_457089 [Neurospora hispaniola]
MFALATCSSRSLPALKSLQRVIFRSHNDGDSVKISIPLASEFPLNIDGKIHPPIVKISIPIKNILNIEETPIVEFADTCKIRVIDNDDTYAIEEYFFSFFSFGKKAIQVLLIPPIPPRNKDITKSLRLAPPIDIIRTEPDETPLMSRMLEARTEMAARPSFDLHDDVHHDDAGGTGQLAKKLKDIFEFDTAEEEEFFDAVDAGTVEVSQLPPRDTRTA